MIKETETNEILTRAKHRLAKADDATFLRWVIGEPTGRAFRIDVEKALMHVATNQATTEDVELLQSLI